MHRRFPGRAQLAHERGIFLLRHRAVYIIRRPLVIARGKKGAVHIDALERHDRRDGIVKMQIELRTQALDRIGHGVAGQRAGGDDDLAVRNFRSFFLNDLNHRVAADFFGNVFCKALAIHSERAAGCDAVAIRTLQNQRIQPAQLLLEQADRVRQLIAAQGVGAHQLRKIRRHVRRGVFLRLHLDQADRDAALRKLPRAFASGESRPDDGYGCHSIPPFEISKKYRHFFEKVCTP